MPTNEVKNRTLALVDKYQKLIGGLLGIEPRLIRFFVKAGANNKEMEIGLEYQPDEDKKDWIEFQSWCEGDFVVKRMDDAASKSHPANYWDLVISTFKLYRMPHCCGIVVSCNANVRETYRHKRVGTVLNNLRQDIARMLGYTVMLCTDIAQNEHQRRLLKTNGWKDVLDFKNRRTGNTVILSYIGL
jgi:hypothetical protein